MGIALYKDMLGIFFWPSLGLAFILCYVSYRVAIAYDLLPFLAFTPLFLWLAGYGAAISTARRNFWKQFAQQHNWQYSHTSDPRLEKALLFSPENGSRVISNVVNGKVNNRPLTIFEYTYTRHGKLKKLQRNDAIFRFTVFKFEMTGNFPHLYLNNHRNAYNYKPNRRIKLNPQFEKQFHLYGPKEYEIEALEIFTPDIMQHLTSQPKAYDIEFVDHHVLIFTENFLKGSVELESSFDAVNKIAGKMFKRLDHVSFKKIGNLPHHLRKDLSSPQ